MIESKEDQSMVLKGPNRVKLCQEEEKQLKDL